MSDTLQVCVVCHGKVASSASKCPHCGAARTGTVYVKRKSNISGALSSIGIFADGDKLGSVDNGGTVYFEASVGRHEIEAKGIMTSTRMTIYVNPGDVLNLTLSIGPFGLKLKQE